MELKGMCAGESNIQDPGEKSSEQLTDDPALNSLFLLLEAIELDSKSPREGPSGGEKAHEPQGEFQKKNGKESQEQNAKNAEKSRKGESQEQEKESQTNSAKNKIKHFEQENQNKGQEAQSESSLHDIPAENTDDMVIDDNQTTIEQTANCENSTAPEKVILGDSQPTVGDDTLTSAGHSAIVENTMPGNDQSAIETIQPADDIDKIIAPAELDDDHLLNPIDATVPIDFSSPIDFDSLCELPIPFDSSDTISQNQPYDPYISLYTPKMLLTSTSEHPSSSSSTSPTRKLTLEEIGQTIRIVIAESMRTIGLNPNEFGLTESNKILHLTSQFKNKRFLDTLDSCKYLTMYSAEYILNSLTSVHSG